MASGTFFFNTGKSYNDRSKDKAALSVTPGEPTGDMRHRSSMSGQVGTGSPKSVTYSSLTRRRG